MSGDVPSEGGVGVGEGEERSGEQDVEHGPRQSDGADGDEERGAMTAVLALGREEPDEVGAHRQDEQDQAPGVAPR